MKILPRVYPSPNDTREAEYSVQEGDEYRKLKVNGAKDYNSKAIFRSQMTEQQMRHVLSSKIIRHVIVHLVPYRELKEGFIENVGEGLGSGMKEILNSFINLVRQDYVDAQFHKGIREVLNDDWVKQMLEKYQEQNKSFLDASSLVVDESDIEEQPQKQMQIGGSATEESLKEKYSRIGFKKDIYMYKGYMKKRKSNL